VVVALTDAVAVADAVDVDVALADAVAMSRRRGSPYRLELLKILSVFPVSLGHKMDTGGGIVASMKLY